MYLLNLLGVGQTGADFSLLCRASDCGFYGAVAVHVQISELHVHFHGKSNVFVVLLNRAKRKFGEMGRRKKKAKPPPKRKAIVPLDKQFNCPFCNHEKSCEVTM